MEEKTEVFMLVEKYNEEQKPLLLKEIFKKVLYENLSYDEYEKLYEIPNKNLKMLVISKAPRKLLVKIFLEENDEDIIDLFEIWQFKEYADELLNAVHWRVRINAVKYASIMKLFERLHNENNYKIIHTISAQLDYCKPSEEEVDKYINSTCSDIREYIALYASKDKLLERLLEENELGVIRVILGRIDDISQEQADKLMDAGNCEVRMFAVKYASKDKLLERLLEEHDTNVISAILSVLKTNK